MNSPNFGFPKRDGLSLSCWLQGVQDDPLLDHNTTPELPSHADIVIIGSGVSALSPVIGMSEGVLTLLTVDRDIDWKALH